MVEKTNILLEKGDNSKTKDLCSKCKKGNHKEEDCWQGKKGCFICKQEDHGPRQCPKNYRNMKNTCFKCKKPGHFAKDCNEDGTETNIQQDNVIGYWTNKESVTNDNDQLDVIEGILDSGCGSTVCGDF